MSQDDQDDPSFDSGSGQPPFRKEVTFPQSGRVGYGRPPVEHRFQPGRSGNPRGRPPGSVNKQPAHWGERLRAIALAEGFREVSLREGAQPVTLPVVAAVLRTVALNALKGQIAAQRLFLEVVAGAEADERRQQEAFIREALTYKAEAEGEIARRQRLGITDVSDILPHPSDIVVDVAADTVRVKGPLTAEQREAWNELVEHRRILRDIIQVQTEKLRRLRSPAKRADTQRLIEVAEQRLAEIEAGMPDWVIRD